MAGSTKFDSASFKQSTRDQWDHAAEAWNRWGSLLEQWCGEHTAKMLDMAGVQLGHRVVDIAAGAGGQSLAAALRVGSRGYVLGTDLSPTILAYAEQNARAFGLTNLETRVVDGESLNELPRESFDAAISRFGVMYFPDKKTALSGIRHVLKPGHKFAAMVFTTAERNPFFSIPISTIRRRARLPPPLPGQPGPFSVGAPGALDAELASAGFREVQSQAFPARLRMQSAAECVRFERESFGALHEMMSAMSEAERQDTWAEVYQALQQFESAGGFEAPCEILISAGTK
jgi:SAM-dependent methyltransferase